MASKKSVLNFTELCSIIKTCGESRVAELKYGDFHVRFHQPVEEILNQASRKPTHPEAEISDEQRKQLEKHALLEDEFRLKQDRLDQMLIESPSEFEELQAMGDLEEDKGSGNVDDAEAHNRGPQSALQ